MPARKHGPLERRELERGKERESVNRSRGRRGIKRGKRIMKIGQCVREIKG